MFSQIRFQSENIKLLACQGNLHDCGNKLRKMLQDCGLLRFIAYLCNANTETPSCPFVHVLVRACNLVCFITVRMCEDRLAYRAILNDEQNANAP